MFLKSIGQVLKTSLPLTKNEFTPLTESVPLRLDLTAAASLEDARTQKKSFCIGNKNFKKRKGRDHEDSYFSQKIWYFLKRYY